MSSWLLGFRGRLYLACIAISSWLVLLLCGVAWGGGVHLLLVISLVAFPWRDATPPGDGADRSES